MNSITSFINRLHNPDLGLLLIRIALGVVFIYHGWGKFAATEQAIGFFASLGFASFFVYLVATVEVAGGVALIAGVLTRYAGILLTIVMAVAIVKVHLANGFSVATGGYEFALVLMLGSAALVTLGAGGYSLEKYLAKSSI